MTAASCARPCRGPRVAFDPQDLARFGVELQLDQLPAGLQQLDLVDPAPAFALEFKFQHLARMGALHTLQQCRQGHDFAGLDRSPGPFMVMLSLAHAAGSASAATSMATLTVKVWRDAFTQALSTQLI
jgi:hypothetical protein